MKHNKTEIIKAFKMACKDMKEILDEKRRYYSTGDFSEVFVVGFNRLNTDGVRKLNNELGLNTIEGLSKWYKN